MKILDTEIDFDLLDADNIEKFENAAKKVKEKCEKKNIETLSYSETIRKECEIINTFFDEVFGKGTAQKIFKGKMSLTEHINAFQDIVNEKIRKQEEVRNTLNRYLPNRQQSRQQKRNKRKK